MVLAYAMRAEFRNTHPIARSIVEKAEALGLTCKEEAHAEILPGLGVKLEHEEGVVLVGNQKLLHNHKLSTKAFEPFAKSHLEDGRTIVYVSCGKKILGALAFEHEVRTGTKEMLEGLLQRGVKHLVLLSGDEEKVAHAFARAYGFNEVYANVMPEGKADVIDVLKTKYAKVVMVGDGINDTIAMSRADVAISFASGGSEAAIEISNIAITRSDPMDILKLYDLSQKSLNVIGQNYWIGTGTNLVGVGLASVGILSPVAAGAIHIGHTVGIMANSSRIVLEK
jgi:cation-transporting P-type ATPase C